MLPPPVAEQMSLTADQQKNVAELEAEVKVKLEKILTPEQLQQLRQMGPPGRQGGPDDENGLKPAGGPLPTQRDGDAGGPGGPGGGPGGQGGMGGQRPVMPIIEALDLNKDGTIDADEIAKASESLKKLDKNKDGKLTPDEFRPQRPGGMGGPGGPGGQGGPGMRGQGRGPGAQGGPGMQGGGPAPGGPGGQGGPQRPELEK